MESLVSSKSPVHIATLLQHSVGALSRLSPLYSDTELVNLYKLHSLEPKTSLQVGLNYPSKSKICWDGKETKGQLGFLCLVSLVNQAKTNFE